MGTSRRPEWFVITTSNPWRDDHFKSVINTGIIRLLAEATHRVAVKNLDKATLSIICERTNLHRDEADAAILERDMKRLKRVCADLNELVDVVLGL